MSSELQNNYRRTGSLADRDSPYDYLNLIDEVTL